tara:strand:- start:847 stop:1422 length:576 start_codon:yes stop_codon:yes gene_type:complete
MSEYSKYYYEIIDKYKKFHRNGAGKLSGEKTFAGYSLSKWIVKIKDNIKINNCDSLLDFGCGKGIYYKNRIVVGNKEYENLLNFWNIQDVYLYDPGVEKYSVYPKKKYDAVICTDVIEHIPEEDVISFIDNLFKLANKFIFVVIATIPASKYFEDGNNIHLCLKDESVWKDIFLSFRNKYPEINQYIHFND